eukprot:1148392-Pelagomonas_calceolata.AAC.4
MPETDFVSRSTSEAASCRVASKNDGRDAHNRSDSFCASLAYSIKVLQLKHVRMRMRLPQTSLRHASRIKDALH